MWREPTVLGNKGSVYYIVHQAHVLCVAGFRIIEVGESEIKTSKGQGNNYYAQQRKVEAIVKEKDKREEEPSVIENVDNVDGPKISTWRGVTVNENS